MKKDQTAMRRKANAERAHKEALKGYQGWDNFETWCVALWLNNEQRLQETAREIIRETVGRAWGAEDALKRWVENNLLPDLGATFASDLLAYAFGGVNWTEIAESFREE
jgi:hypothetical protein